MHGTLTDTASVNRMTVLQCREDVMADLEVRWTVHDDAAEMSLLAGSVAHVNHAMLIRYNSTLEALSQRRCNKTIICKCQKVFLNVSRLWLHACRTALYDSHICNRFSFAKRFSHY